jgi:hypothetical protein
MQVIPLVPTSSSMLGYFTLHQALHDPKPFFLSEAGIAILSRKSCSERPFCLFAKK